MLVLDHFVDTCFRLFKLTRNLTIPSVQKLGTTESPLCLSNDPQLFLRDL